MWPERLGKPSIGCAGSVRDARNLGTTRREKGRAVPPNPSKELDEAYRDVQVIDEKL
jgi:hypothetical protein